MYLFLMSFLYILFTLQGKHKLNFGCGRLTPQENLSKHNIMAAVLQTAGPVSTQPMLTSNWKFLHLLTVKQFNSAAGDLQTLGLGAFVAIQNGTRAAHVFVKKEPSLVREILQEHPELRTDPDYYEQRYCMPASKKIKLNLRAKLVSMKLLTENQLML